MLTTRCWDGPPTPCSQDLLPVLETRSRRYPDMRLGQLLINLSNWATLVPDGLWDVEDEALLNAAKDHLARQTTAAAQ